MPCLPVWQNVIFIFLFNMLMIHAKYLFYIILFLFQFQRHLSSLIRKSENYLKRRRANAQLCDMERVNYLLNKVPLEVSSFIMFWFLNYC